MRTALITGASRGIGHGIAVELARQGFGLTVTSRRDEDLTALAAELTDTGAPGVVPVAADLGDRTALAAVIDRHRQTYATMDALILSGGVGTGGALETLPAHRVDKTIAVNLTSAIAMVQTALPLLRAAAAADREHGARVIALSSITGVHAERGLAVYGASKAALISLMETVNAEESANGVMATAIAPAYVATDMSAWTTDTIPADTMIPVDDVVAVVRMLLEFGATTSLTKVVLSRSGTSGFTA
ncbi:SDR family NAD(P)-dependent oxidoreductase [Amycolatopsis pithecellobii]|uniref:SDR family NAD(P)-dependent oxidoreductase n=1 Tax=Amycolatopsis pithecellobii TaxID=664692 RepID=A0A6N7Z1T6_9PSEU|nr:SDR family oxidoreductase [Amycolatopsis pithecellobii]MTD53690.1 SDR family NAD(P)-dependent oxidoreductase [Amycolatopsis pithecellobii]